MTSKNTYYRRKELGLCVACGGEIEEDRKGKVLCKSCKDKDNIKHNEDRKWYQSINICPICKKERLYNGEKICIICKSKQPYDPEKKSKDYFEKYREHSIEHRKNRYHEAKENGICTYCFKRKAVDGLSVCSICRVKRNNQAVERRRDSVEANARKKENWVKNGLCPVCGDKSKEGFKLCEKHYQIVWNNFHTENAINNRERMKREDKRFFMKY
nr:MAG TPA: hypothetical protein [Caudoviricetes sp.]